MISQLNVLVKSAVSRRRLVLLFCVMTGSSLFMGCASGVKVTTLSGVVQDGRRLDGTPISTELVAVTRNGAFLAFSQGLALQKDDAISTGANAGVVIDYPSGARVYILPNSKVRIGSIFLEIGKLIVKVKGIFEVRTELATAGSEGTEYWVEVGARQQVNVGVIEDKVNLSSNTGRWPPVKLLQNTKAVVNTGSAPTISPATLQEMQRERDWINKMDSLFPVYERPKGGFTFGIGIGGGVGGQRGDQRGDQRDQNNVPGKPPR
jgi:FecR protein